MEKERKTATTKRRKKKRKEKERKIYYHEPDRLLHDTIPATATNINSQNALNNLKDNKKNKIPNFFTIVKM